MRLLLDTHVYIWFVAEPERLDPETLGILVSGGHQLVVSSVTPWEIAIKRGLGRLIFPLDRFDDTIAGMAGEILPVQPAHGIAAGALPLLHRDPFDRMLIAQARIEDLTLVSGDQAILQYDVRLLRVSAG